jgi:hypothetical protein
LVVRGWFNTVQIGHVDFIANAFEGVAILGAAWTPVQGLEYAVLNDTAIEFAGTSFRQNMKGGLRIVAGCTVRRYVVTRCTFSRNRAFDLAIAGYVVAYDTNEVFLEYDNSGRSQSDQWDLAGSLRPTVGIVGIGAKQVINRTKTLDLCIHRTVTIRDVDFDQFVSKRDRQGLRDVAQLQKGKDTALEKKIVRHLLKRILTFMVRLFRRGKVDVFVPVWRNGVEW